MDGQVCKGTCLGPVPRQNLGDFAGQSRSSAEGITLDAATRVYSAKRCQEILSR